MWNAKKKNLKLRSFVPYTHIVMLKSLFILWKHYPGISVISKSLSALAQKPSNPATMSSVSFLVVEVDLSI